MGGWISLVRAARDQTLILNYSSIRARVLVSPGNSFPGEGGRDAPEAVAIKKEIAFSLSLTSGTYLNCVLAGSLNKIVLNWPALAVFLFVMPLLKNAWVWWHHSHTAQPTTVSTFPQFPQKWLSTLGQSKWLEWIGKSPHWFSQRVLPP